jgi:hypothetical protein
VPGIDPIPPELIKAGSRKIRSEIHKLILFGISWNKELITVPLYKKGDKTGCRNCRGMSLLSTMYNILSILMLSRMTPKTEEIIGDHTLISTQQVS